MELVIMKFITKEMNISIKEVFDNNDIENIIYGNMYDYEKKFLLQIQDYNCIVEFMDLNKIPIIVFKDYLILIDDLNMHIVNHKIYKQVDLESYYLGYVFLEQKLYIIFQTGLLSLDADVHVNKIFTDFINDYLYKICIRTHKTYFVERLDSYKQCFLNILVHILIVL